MKAYNPLQDKVINVTKEGDHYVDQDGCMWEEDELHLFQEPDWQHYRIQAAIAAMQGMIANQQTFEQLDHDKGYQEIRGGDKSQIVAIASVMYADALVEELKGGQDDNHNQ